MAIGENPICFGEVFDVIRSSSSEVFLVVSDDEGHMQGTNCKLQAVLDKFLKEGDVVVVPGPYNYSVDLQACPRLCLIAGRLQERGVRVEVLDPRSPLNQNVAADWEKIDALRAQLIQKEQQMLRTNENNRLKQLRDEWLKGHQEVEQRAETAPIVECFGFFNDRDFVERVKEIRKHACAQQIVVLCDSKKLVGRDWNYYRLQKLANQLDASLVVPTDAPVDRTEARGLLRIFSQRGSF